MTLNSTEYCDDRLATILQTIEELNHLKDVDSILDNILHEARRISNADAGSIFMVENDNLKFGYVHNDTLFKGDEGREALYVDFAVPINEKSIVGYAALTKEALEIEDAYHIPHERPYAFNPDYDRRSGYKTGSMLTIPLKTLQGRIVGVMQLINAKDENGMVVPFSEESQVYVPLFANNAAVAIERGIMNRELILRMVKMAELRDPSETGAHVQRVGSYAAEIYQRWAARNGIELKEMKHEKDIIRLASMLHDVGKVGIPDTILKKPGKLTDSEFDIIKMHTIFGGRLFVNQTSMLDSISKEIALNHHEKWNGKGYPGRVKDIFDPEATVSKDSRSGTEIPLPARIVALADVYDALCSRRSYKEPWTDEKVLSIIESESGEHFDPELVEIFFEIYGVIKAIRNKFKG
ncbi:MAG: HD domain-containing protein [Deltaproteobacteria bacterium]|nr:HD domain-containing protein [Deltaproteobacteria bacterium]